MSAFQIASQITETVLSWKQVFLACPLVFIATTLPLSPGGIGVGETAASVLFSLFEVKTGATIMLIVRLWWIVLRIPGFLFFVIHRISSPIEHDTEDSNPF